MHNTASTFHCHTCWLEFKMLLPPAKKQKTPACIREIQVHKLWTKVYSQKGLTAMESPKVAVLITNKPTVSVKATVRREANTQP